jgi:hypothetical protein
MRECEHTALVTWKSNDGDRDILWNIGRQLPTDTADLAPKHFIEYERMFKGQELETIANAY